MRLWSLKPMRFDEHDQKKSQPQPPASKFILPPCVNTYFAWHDISVLNGELNLPQIFIMWVGTADKVFKVRGQRSRSWREKLIYNDGDVHFEGIWHPGLLVFIFHFTEIVHNNRVYAKYIRKIWCVGKTKYSGDNNYVNYVYLKAIQNKSLWDVLSFHIYFCCIFAPPEKLFTITVVVLE